MYDLIGVVVHCGSGPYRGHYITIVKSHGYWLLYDDDIVEVMCTSTSCCMIHTEKRHTLGVVLFTVERLLMYIEHTGVKSECLLWDLKKNLSFSPSLPPPLSSLPPLSLSLSPSLRR